MLGSDSLVLFNLRQTNGSYTLTPDGYGYLCDLERCGKKQLDWFCYLNKKCKIVNNVEKRIEFSYVLPGTGRKPVNCLPFYPVGFCPSCGKVHIARGNCGSPLCPDCSVYWRYERVESIFNKIFSYKISKKTRVVHVTVSFPPEFIELIRCVDDINEMRDLCYRYCESKGMDGGLLIFHPYRLKKDKKKELRCIAKKTFNWSPGDFHLWKVLVSLPNWRDFVYFSPHFHILGCCSDLQPGLKEDGLIFKKIGDLLKPADIVKCSMYLLSHAGIYKKNNSKNVFWFGGLGNRNFCFNNTSIDVQKYTIFIRGNILKGFSSIEGVSYNHCQNCGEKFLPICIAPRYFTNFSFDVNNVLKYCYNWYVGSIPPPAAGAIKGILSGVLKNEL